MSSMEDGDKAAAAVSTHPRVSKTGIEAAIAHRYDVNAADAVGCASSWQVKPDGSSGVGALKVLSLCFLVMKNGFTIVGMSAPASPENFDAKLGKKLAYDNAVRQCWPLTGFALLDRLSEGIDDPNEIHGVNTLRG